MTRGFVIGLALVAIAVWTLKLAMEDDAQFGGGAAAVAVVEAR